MEGNGQSTLGPGTRTWQAHTTGAGTRGVLRARIRGPARGFASCTLAGGGKVISVGRFSRVLTGD